MRNIIFTILLITLLSHTINTQKAVDSNSVKEYTDCSWYCERIKAWNVYGQEYKNTYMFDSPITPKWIAFYTPLLAKCLSSGTLPQGETCTLEKLPTPIIVVCPKNQQPRLGVCEACPQGFELKHGKCVKTVLMTCKPGFELLNGHCVSICKTDEKVVGGKCVKRCTSPQQWVKGKCELVCKKTERVSKGKCVPKCKSQMRVSKTSGKCIKRCKNANMSFRDGKCVAKEQCKYGYVRVSGKCHKICTKPGTVLRGTKCEKINPCKKNEAYNQTTKKCLEICKKNEYIKNGQCVKVPVDCWSKKQCKHIVMSKLKSKHKEIQVVLANINEVTFGQIDSLDEDDDERRLLLNYYKNTARRVQQLNKHIKVTVKKPVVKKTAKVTVKKHAKVTVKKHAKVTVHSHSHSKAIANAKVVIKKHSSENHSSKTGTDKSGNKTITTTTTKHTETKITLHPRLVYLNAKLLVLQKEFSMLRTSITKCTKKICPHGDKCNKKNICVKPDVPTCKKDEILKDGKCLKACNVGQILKNGKCILNCNKNQVYNTTTNKCDKLCKLGLSLVDGKCKKVCKLNEILYKGECVIGNPCPHGQHLNKAKECVAVCKKTEDFVKGQCVKRIVCSKFEILRDDVCIKICREDEYLNSKNECRKHCDAGWVLKGSTCVHVCPDGQYLGADCICRDMTPQCFTKEQCVTRYEGLIEVTKKSIKEAQSHLKGTPIAKFFDRKLQVLKKKADKKIGGVDASTAVWKEKLYNLEAHLHTYNLQKAKCFKKKCDKGYLCKNQVCKKTIVIKTCPKDFKLVNGVCTKTFVPECPPGTQMTAENTCTKIINFVVVTKCKSPAKMIGNKCVTILPPKPIEECPEGSRRVKDECVRTTISCTKGYKKVGTKCILIKCQSGFKKDKDGNCVKVVVPTIKCPAGSKLDKTTKKCVQPPKPLECPEGWKKVGKTCLKTIVTVSCPPTYKLNKETKKCEKTIISVTCKAPAVKIGNKCITMKPVEIVECPKGSKRVGSKCEKVLVCPKGSKKMGDKCIVQKCKSGFKKDKDGNCVKIVIAIIHCPKGSKLDEKTNKCVQPPKPLTCEKGWKMVGKTCVKTIVSCDKGFKLNKKTDKCEKTVTVVTCEKPYVLNKKEKVCVKTIVTKSCDKGYTRDGDDCVKYECPKGSRLEGTKCTEINPKPVCDKGFIHNKKSGLCEKTIITESCDEGYTLKGKDCIKEVIKTSCPEGYKFDAVSKNCTKTITVVVPCKKGWVRDGNDCIKKEVVGCEEGYTKNAKTNKCEKCPKGSKIDNGKCHIIKKPCTDKPGLVFKNGKCVPICSTSENLIKNKCVKIICKSGEKLDKSLPKKKCVKITCPKGSKLVGNKCVKIIVVCKKPQVLKAGKCVTVKVVCKSPNVMINGFCVTPTRPPVPCERDEVRVNDICKPRCYPDQRWNSSLKKCEDRWSCWDFSSCQKRYTAYATEVRDKIKKIDTCSMFPTKVVVKPTVKKTSKVVKPKKHILAPKKHLVAPSRVLQNLVNKKKPVVKVTVKKPVVKVTTKKTAKCTYTKEKTALLKELHHLFTYFGKKLSACKALRCQTNFTCDAFSHKCKKLEVPSCSVKEILKNGKCTPKCKESETYSEVTAKCQGCKKGTKWNEKSKRCEKVIVVTCPKPTTKNAKTGKCDCPKATTKDKKLKACVKTIVKHTCPKGYKKVDTDKCIKIVVNYKHVCPKGYKQKGKQCFKHTHTVIYEDPTPAPEEDRLTCYLRFAKVIQKLTDQKEEFMNDYTGELRAKSKTYKTQVELDRVNLLIETWVSNMDACDKLEIKLDITSEWEVTTIQDIYMCGDYRCTKKDHTKWLLIMKESYYAIKKQQIEITTRITTIKKQITIAITESKKIETEWIKIFTQESTLYETIYTKEKQKDEAKRKCKETKDKKYKTQMKTLHKEIVVLTKKLTTYRVKMVKSMTLYAESRISVQKLRSELIEVELDMKITELKYKYAKAIYESVTSYEKITSKFIAETKKMVKTVTTSTDKTAIKAKITAKLAADKKKAISIWKKVEEMIKKSEIDVKTLEEQDWKRRSTTVSLQKKNLTCQTNIVSWNKEVTLLRKRRYSLLVSAAGKSQPPKLKALLRLLQTVSKPKTLVKTRTVTKQGKLSSKHITHTKQGTLVHTHSTETIKRGKYYKLSFKEVETKMQKYQKSILHCSAIVKAMPAIIARRQANFRDHIDNQSTCKAREFKAHMVLKGRMGSLEKVEQRISDMIKRIAAAKATNKDKKQVNGLEKAEKKANHFINDLKYKKWSLDWNMYQIRLLAC